MRPIERRPAASTRNAGRRRTAAQAAVASLALLLIGASGMMTPRSAAADDITVAMRGIQYQPQRLEAERGDVLRFVNEDGVDHDVFVPTPGFGVDLGKSEPGSVKELPLAMTGTFEVECVLHANMLLTVTVRK